MILRQFRNFFLVGGIGFLVDACILYLLLKSLGPYYSRIISFLLAVLVTWLLNRYFVFSKTQNFTREGVRYLSVQGVGFLINLIFYSYLVYRSFAPLLALIIASAVALFWNFTGAKYIVFKENN